MENNIMNLHKQIPVMIMHRAKDVKEISFAHDAIFIDLSQVYVREDTSDGIKFYLGKGRIDRKKKWILPAESRICICGIEVQDGVKEERFREV